MSLLRPRFQIAGFVKFTALFGVILAVMHARFGGIGVLPGITWRETVLLPSAVALALTVSLLRPRPSSPRCQACGRKYRTTGSAREAGLCPSCRNAMAPPAERRRRERLGLFLLASLFFLLAIVLVWPFAGFLEARQGWLAAPALTVGLAVGLLLLFCGAMIVRLLAGSLSMRLPGRALKAARTCAGEPGRHVALGPISVHVFGPGDPTPMLQQQVEICRSRFEALTGEPLDPALPLRVFAFSRRAAFEGFCRRNLVSATNVDGLFFPWSARTIVMTSEFPPYRLANPERVLRTLLTYFYLEAIKTPRTSLWIQAGVANLVACGGDGDELARLNRKLLASLARGTEIGAAGLFHAHPTAWARLVRNSQDFASFTKYTQFLMQAWSLVEYLAGREAPTERREQFRGFLRALKPGAEQEAVFTSHFGHGFEDLLAQWKAWVLDHGVGTHRLPPDHVRRALLERLIPIVRDRSADPRQRTEAIREMSRAGYVLGADALIEVLADDQVPAEEAIWALEAISGLNLDDDARRWSEEWLAGLPAEATGLATGPHA
jgi:hypothetical protein